MIVFTACLFLLALAPFVLGIVNFREFLPPHAAGGTAKLSVLLPARDEARNIAEAIQAIRASQGVEFEVIVLDDHSTDDTAAIARAAAGDDSRVRVESAPPLPPGWAGKPHACHVLAGLARYPLLVFVDADVRLAPDALRRMAGFMDTRPIGLASGLPQQEFSGLLDRLVVPLLHFRLLGYFPLGLMRRSLAPRLGAGWGQLVVARAASYRYVGGHAAVAASFHDGPQLARAFRRKGIMTDLFDATPIARCRMYRSAGEVWRGFAKDAAEGTAAAWALPMWLILLAGGQILPFVMLPTAIGAANGPWVVGLLTVAVAAAWLLRGSLAARFRQPWMGVVLHPLGVTLLLAIQVQARLAQMIGRRQASRGRLRPVADIQ